jgi:hypothetical protein
MKRLLSALFLIAVAVAADKPDFSGKWKMSPEKSKFGPAPPPTSMTLVVDHKGPDITVQQSSTGPDGEQNITSKYSTKGKETINSLMGNEVKSTAAWEGKTLVIRSTLDGGVVKFLSKWTLSADGQILTDAVNISSPQGNLDLTYVLVKQ